MKQVRVTDPSGREWVVRRRWLPWSVRWRGPVRPRTAQRKESQDRGWLEFLDFADPLLAFDEGFGGFVAVVAVVLLIVLAVLFVLPLFIFLVELVLVALIVAGAVLTRVLFRRPWLVDALVVEGVPAQHLIWKAVGWGDSGVAVDQIAEQIRAGSPTPNARGATLVSGAS
jgi:hypothetical protein